MINEEIEMKPSLALLRLGGRSERPTAGAERYAVCPRSGRSPTSSGACSARRGGVNGYTTTATGLERGASRHRGRPAPPRHVLGRRPFVRDQQVDAANSASEYGAHVTW